MPALVSMDAVEARRIAIADLKRQFEWEKDPIGIDEPVVLSEFQRMIPEVRRSELIGSEWIVTGWAHIVHTYAQGKKPRWRRRDGHLKWSFAEQSFDRWFDYAIEDGSGIIRRARVDVSTPTGRAGSSSLNRPP